MLADDRYWAEADRPEGPVAHRGLVGRWLLLWGVLVGLLARWAVEGRRAMLGHVSWMSWRRQRDGARDWQRLRPHEGSCTYGQTISGSLAAAPRLVALYFSSNQDYNDEPTDNR